MNRFAIALAAVTAALAVQGAALAHPAAKPAASDSAARAKTMADAAARFVAMLDPDGNQMEFSVDCFASKAECAAFFEGDALGNNPAGVEYDPDNWLARLRSGTPEAELLAIDPSGEVSPLRGRFETLLA